MEANAPKSPAESIQLLLARAMIHGGKIKDALDTLTALLRIDPANSQALEIFYQLAGSYGDLCCEQMEKLVSINASNIQLRAAAAGLYLVIGKPEKELAHLEFLYRKGINTEPFCLQYATALRNTAQILKALQICNKALAVWTKSVPLLKLRGDLFLAQNETGKALKDFTSCALLQPDDLHARLKVGSTRLLISDCEEGFDEFSAHRDMELTAHKLIFSIPEWQGQSLENKRVLAWDSQGIGDIIMFSSFLPWLLEQKAHITLALYLKLMPLFSRSFPEADVTLLSNDLANRYSTSCDYHIPMGQLMAMALPHYVPAQKPAFLIADTARSEALREKYLELSNGKAKKVIGISWHTTNADTSRQRSIPLIEWSPLFLIPGIQWVSLQYGKHDAEITAIQQHFQNPLYCDLTVDTYDDIDGLAAQIKAMDEVITIDNSAIHLAGALGTPATLLLSAASNWRWGFNHIMCRWYKSVNIERQTKLFDWQPVMERLRARLIT